MPLPNVYGAPFFGQSDVPAESTLSTRQRNTESTPKYTDLFYHEILIQSMLRHPLRRWHAIRHHRMF